MGWRLEQQQQQGRRKKGDGDYNDESDDGEKKATAIRMRRVKTTGEKADGN